MMNLDMVFFVFIIFCLEFAEHLAFIYVYFSKLGQN